VFFVDQQLEVLAVAVVVVCSTGLWNWFLWCRR